MVSVAFDVCKFVFMESGFRHAFSNYYARNLKGGVIIMNPVTRRVLTGSKVPFSAQRRAGSISRDIHVYKNTDAGGAGQDAMRHANMQ